MKPTPKQFMQIWALSAGIVTAIVFSFNALVDPYLAFGVPRLEGFNARKPSIETHTHLIKARDVLRSSPRTVLLGTSSVALGIDANDPAWLPEQRHVYNLAIRGGGPYTSYRYLQHVMSRGEPNLVVLGLDFHFFLDAPEFLFIDEEFERRLEVQADGTANAYHRRQQFYDLLQATLSLEAVKDSATTLGANMRKSSPDIRAGNWENSRYFQFAAERGGRWVEFWDRRMLALYRGRQFNDRDLKAIRDIVDLCRTRGVDLILFVSPMHANELEAIELTGFWSSFESWKRDLATLVADRGDRVTEAQIQLWDFTGYDCYSTSEMGGSADVHWFWDSSHYDQSLGRLIVRRLVGHDNIAFGQQVTLENLEQHLEGVRIGQRLYHARDGIGAQHMHELHKSMFGDSN